MINCPPEQRQCSSYRLFLLLSIIIVTACTSQPRHPKPERTGTDLVVEVASLQLETPRFFTYQYNGKNLSYFVMRMNTGVQSYLDACASCYPHKLGYQYKNGVVMCRFCNQNFSVNKLDKGLGGCYPIKIEGRIENGKYLIPIAALERAADKF
jgi:uncharacterized membrane protein